MTKNPFTELVQLLQAWKTLDFYPDEFENRGPHARVAELLAYCEQVVQQDTESDDDDIDKTNQYLLDIKKWLFRASETEYSDINPLDDARLSQLRMYGRSVAVILKHSPELEKVFGLLDEVEKQIKDLPEQAQRYVAAVTTQIREQLDNASLITPQDFTNAAASLIWAVAKANPEPKLFGFIMNKIVDVLCKSNLGAGFLALGAESVRELSQ